MSQIWFFEKKWSKLQKNQFSRIFSKFSIFFIRKHLSKIMFLANLALFLKMRKIEIAKMRQIWYLREKNVK